MIAELHERCIEGWRSVLSSSLGDTWSRFDASCHETGGQLESLTAMQIDVDVGVDTAMGAFAAEPATSSTEGIDVSFLVSGALLLSCRSGPALQIVRSSQINHELGIDPTLSLHVFASLTSRYCHVIF